MRFGRADLEQAAQQLADILHEEKADLLLSYQSNGGYGHRDHVQVHHVGARAAELAATRACSRRRCRELLRRTSQVARALRLPAPYEPDVVHTVYAARATITHRINVFPFARQKRDAFAAHRSQIEGSRAAAGLFGVLLRLPPQVFGVLLSREWFVDPAAGSSGTVRPDIFD